MIDISKLKCLTEEDILHLDEYLSTYQDDVNYFKTKFLFKTYWETIQQMMDDAMELYEEDEEKENKGADFEEKVQFHVFNNGTELLEEEIIEKEKVDVKSS